MMVVWAVLLICNFKWTQSSKVSGKNPAQNVIAHMQHEGRVARAEKRGYYTLASEYVAGVDVEGKG